MGFDDVLLDSIALGCICLMMAKEVKQTFSMHQWFSMAAGEGVSLRVSVIAERVWMSQYERP